MESYEENAIHSVDENSILTNTFFRMFLGLLASAGAALYAYYSGMAEAMIYGRGYLTLAIVEIIIVLLFSFLFKKLSPTMVTVLFFAYAFVNGFTLFGILAFVGYKTEKDISKFGTILGVSLLVGLILTIINIFIGSSFLDIVLDWAMLFIFCGLTVYDMNKIKEMQNMGFCEDEKLYVYGAMELYLDFINIFLRILSLFAKRRD